MSKKPDYIDLLLDYLDGNLEKGLADDIKNTLPNDPVLNTTVEGLAELYEEHGWDREALRVYLKKVNTEINSNLLKKGYGQKEKPNRLNLKTILLSIFGVSLLVFSVWFLQKSKVASNSQENTVIDKVDKSPNDNQPEFEQNIKEVEEPSTSKKDKLEPIENNKKPTKKSKPTQPIAFGGNGSYEKLPHIESMIGTDFRNSSNQILQDTIVRNIFYTATQSLEVNKVFAISKQYLSNNPTFYLFNFDTEDSKMSYKILEEKYNFQEHLPLGLYYWSIEVEGISPIYGSILIQNK